MYCLWDVLSMHSQPTQTGPEGDCLRRVVRAEGGYEVVRELVGMPGDGMGSV